jgi:hypothetical protein
MTADEAVATRTRKLSVMAASVSESPGSGAVNSRGYKNLQVITREQSAAPLPHPGQPMKRCVRIFWCAPRVPDHVDLT